MAIFLLFLCACAKNGTEGETAAPSPAETADIGQGADTEPSQAGAEEQPAAPVYTSLPAAETPDKNMIFRQYADSTGSGEGSEAAVYQDVSAVKNAVAVSSFYGGRGDTVSASLDVCGEVDFCALDLEVTYDTSRLRFVGAASCDKDTIVNSEPEEGKILLNFLQVQNLHDNIELCDLTFEVKTDETCDSAVQLYVKQVVGVGADGEITYPAFSAVDGTAHLNAPGR